ncbi:MAG: hypothetical protein KAT75_06805 [Dehalococcoidia bacterium]|nr:hypothetical protein [Dehalococcoidia bacterium]
MDWKFWIPILISVAAIVFTGISWWYLWQSPFKLEFSAGRPLISKSPSPSDATLFSTTPVIPVSLMNTGARGGMLIDIRLLVRTDIDNRVWILRPYFFCSEFGIGGLEEEKREVFHPFFLRGREGIVKNILFNPVFQGESLQPMMFSLDSKMPPKDTWTFEYYILDSSSSEYKLVQEQTFTLTNKQILSGTYIPDTSDIIDANKRLIDKLK